MDYDYTALANGGRLATLPPSEIHGSRRQNPVSKQVRYCHGLKIVLGERQVCGTRLNQYNDSKFCGCCAHVPIESTRTKPLSATNEEFEAFLASQKKK